MEVKAKGKDPNDSAEKGKSEERLGGNITLSGFSLEPIEMIVVRKIVGNYAKKISEKIDYQELKITLKQAEKNKMFLHTIHVQVRAGRGVEASSENKNLYTALSEALNKVYAQIEHKH